MAAKKHVTAVARPPRAKAAVGRRRVPVRALAKLVNAHWAIARGELDGMVSIANRDGIGAVSREMLREEPEICTMTIRNGVAVIPVIGPTFRYASWMQEICGATSYDAIARDLTAALDDPKVKAVLFEIDSPGGEVTGCNQTSRMIREARGRKPIVAWVEGDACSAAYWLASSCDHIVIDECAQLGSIGVVGIYTDTSKRDEKAGIRTYEIVSSQSPGKRPDPATEEGRSAVQAIIDDLAEVFVGAVAENRGVTREGVLERFGQGGCFVGAKAIEAGLADEIGTFDEVLDALAESDGQAGLSVARPPSTLGEQSKSGAARAAVREVTMAVDRLRTKLAGKGAGKPGATAQAARNTGRKAAAKKRSEQEEDEQAEDEEDETTSMEGPADDEDDTGANDGEGDDEEASDDEDETGATDVDDEEDDTEEEVTPPAKGKKKGAMTERERIAAITRSPEAKGRRALAEHLAFETDLAPAAAIAALGKAPASASKPAGKRGQAFYDAMEREGGNPKIASSRAGKPLSDEDAFIAACISAGEGDGLNAKKKG